jgi:hypothetical protein
VFIERDTLRPGAENQGLRILRVRTDERGLRLTLEGRGGRSYQLQALSPRRLLAPNNPQVKAANANGLQQLSVTFDGPANAYIRREFVIPFRQ